MILYAVEEAVASGIEQIVIVVGSGTSVIEEHFDSHPALERWLEDRGDIELLRAVRRQSEIAAIAYVRQKEPLGLGHAVLMAKELVGDESFAVILPDDVILNPGGAPVMAQLLEAHAAHRGSVLAITKVPPGERSRYGIVRTTRGEGRLWELADVVEKPPADEAPSDLAVLGRYVLSPRIFDKLEHTQQGAGGEIQLTDAIRALMADQPVYGYEFTGVRHDAGSRLGWLEANVSIALESDLADDFRAYLRGLDLRD